MSCAKSVLTALVLASSLPAAAAEDLGALQVQGQRGQSLEQTRRDRYECHNWAVAQTGESPPSLSAAGEPADDGKGELKRERIARAIVGATIGGALGGLFGEWHEVNEQVVAGAAVGAGIGAATAGAGRKEAAALQGPSDYLRALTACLEGRGYSISLPPRPELTASR